MQHNPEFPEQGRLSIPSDRYLHLWYIRLASLEERSGDTGILTLNERERADRFRNPAARKRFIAARIALRRLLSAYLDLPEGEIPLEIGPEGKPELGGDLATILTFNLSHSEEWILIGFAGGTAIGLDLEAVRPFQEVLEVAARVLTVDEVERLRQLAHLEQEGAFFRGWTRKEALQKARGVGIWDRPTRIASGLGSSSGDPSIRVVPDEDSSSVWTVQGIPAPAGYFAAAAMMGEGFRVEILRSPTDY